MSTKTNHITPVGGNVFADLGFTPKEAAALKRQSQRIIAQKLALKTRLMAELAQWVKTRKLKQADAAQILGVTRPRVSDAINRKTSKFTIDALIDMVAKTGKRVEVSVQ